MRGCLTPVYESLIKYFPTSDDLCQSITKQPCRFRSRLWGAMTALVKLRHVLVLSVVIVTVVDLLFHLFPEALLRTLCERPVRVDLRRSAADFFLKIDCSSGAHRRINTGLLACFIGSMAAYHDISGSFGSPRTIDRQGFLF